MNSATVGSKSFERELVLLTERLKAFDVQEIQAAELDSSLLEDFRALCAKFASFDLQQQQASRQADFYEPSRAGEPRISLTPQLVKLRQLELALLSQESSVSIWSD